MIKIRKGTRAELRKYYTVMEIDFDEKELLGKQTMQKGLAEGSLDMWVAYEDESGIDIAYAVVLPKCVYGYAIIKYLGVFPWYRNKGVGTDVMRLLLAEYKDTTGLIAEIPVFEENDDEQITRLRNFFKRFGFEEVKADYRIGGAPVILMCRPVTGTADIAPVSHRIITDIYTRFIPVEQIDIHKLKEV